MAIVAIVAIVAIGAIGSLRWLKGFREGIAFLYKKYGGVKKVS